MGNMNLWDYQKEAVEFSGEKKKIYLALDMGMGKTLTALAAAEKFGKKNTLVIAEKNEIVNSQNFKRETEAYFPAFNYVSLRDEKLANVLHASRIATRHVCGVNPDALVKLNPDEVKAAFDYAIIDEATMAKTTTTDRFKAVRRVCRDMEYVDLLSGTPMMNGASEIYAPLLLMGHPLAGDGSTKAREAFESIFAGGHRRKIKNTGKYWLDYVWWAKGANHVRELRYLINDKFYFRRKADTNVFHKKVRTIERVPMSLEWIIEYNAAWDAYLKEAGKRNVNMESVMELQRLIENGQCYQVNSRWKAKQVAEDIAAGKYGSQRIVVFTLYIESFDVLGSELSSRGISWNTFENLQEWKDSGDQVLIGRIKAHGKGGNVSEASVALFVDMDFVPANNIQAENRIDRPEQTRDMTVVYYMAEGDGIVDEHVRFINQDKIRKIDEFMRPLDAEEIADMPRRLENLKERYGKYIQQLGYSI